MDENINISAYHEAGHALMAHIVEWTIDSIILNIKNEKLLYGVTNYNFGIDKLDSWTNIHRRVLCLLGGPVSQALYENNTILDLDSLGEDGKSIDKLLINFNPIEKTKIIQDAIQITVNLLKFKENNEAIHIIKDTLISNHQISHDDFISLVNGCNVKRMSFK